MNAAYAMMSEGIPAVGEQRDRFDAALNDDGRPAPVPVEKSRNTAALMTMLGGQRRRG